ncbi:hypothetical protein KRR38_10135 [Novosphingobium sp. G106]|uniref:hypothetical protein n=1 Tax=Novosphingobium sp. G106 TaxID=2849500 RepID=UPI001C2D277D|nr:hypothetical protein [Novosphingobium sp. G106]MBV1688023.1 hypothetical protein [Novosphingobium sp. G106]
MTTALNRWWLWLASNMIGIGIFLYLGAQTWMEPELADIPGASGGEFVVWGITALPIFLLFFVAHFAFGFGAHRQRKSDGIWHGYLFLGSTLFCWIAAFLFDNAHHGI